MITWGTPESRARERARPLASSASDNRREQADRTTPEETAPADTEEQIFDYQVALGQFANRVFAYALLLTDQYPAFEGEYPVRYDVR